MNQIIIKLFGKIGTCIVINVFSLEITLIDDLKLTTLSFSHKCPVNKHLALRYQNIRKLLKSLVINV